MSRDSGLDAAALAGLARAVDPVVRGARIRDVARLADRDDLILFLDRPDEERIALQIAPGGIRGRICPTRRRFGKAEFATGPLVDRLRVRLAGCSIDGVEQSIPNERHLSIHLTADEPSTEHAATLAVELFGPRGLWALLGSDGVVLELSRLPEFRDRTVRPGRTYAAPAAPPSQTSAPPQDVDLEEVDRRFSVRDRAEDVERIGAVLTRALARQRKKLENQRTGFQRQIDGAGDAPMLRQRADLLLAYGFQAPPGATELRVPGLDDPDQEIVLPLTPGKPVHQQAEALYDKAKRKVEAAKSCPARLDAVATELTALEQHENALAEARTTRGGDLRALFALFRRLTDAGLLRRPAPLAGARAKAKQKPKKGAAAENFRRFRSAERFEVLVGRDNRQNDRLSVRYAKGNDLWFHIGGGHAGSHVVVRIPKGKHASLETLLDAATLAIHYSKARGADPGDVIYTQAKHVRKPKGLPPGKVLATQTKELRVRFEPDRLRRILASGAGDEA